MLHFHQTPINGRFKTIVAAYEIDYYTVSGWENMARYKYTDAAAGQGLFLTVNLQEQLLPGTFEYMLDRLIGTKIDVSIFDQRYKNDFTGASAIPPTVLVKLIIYGYYTGNKSSRKISELNSNNMVAKALTGDMEIHWTTIADFISSSSKEIEIIFEKVLLYCNELGLIGGETFAMCLKKRQLTWVTSCTKWQATVRETASLGNKWGGRQKRPQGR